MHLVNWPTIGYLEFPSKSSPRAPTCRNRSSRKEHFASGIALALGLAMPGLLGRFLGGSAGRPFGT